MNRTVISTEKAPAAVGPYSQAVKTEQFVFTSGQIGINPLTGQLRLGIEEQTRQVLANLAAVASALLVAANARTESRGAHTRDDWPETDPDLALRLVIG